MRFLGLFGRDIGISGPLQKAIFDPLRIWLKSLADKFTGAGMTEGQRQSADYEFMQQRQLNEEEYQRKIDFYERFESPQAQVNQYKAAGLNPALMYGNGASVFASGGIGSAGDASVPSSAGESLVGLISSILSVNMQKRQLDSEVSLRNREMDIQDYEAKTRRMETEGRLPTYSATAANLLKQTESIEFDLGVKKDVRDILVDNYNLDNQARFWEIQSTQKNIDYIDARITNLTHQNKQLDALVNQAYANIRQMDYFTQTYYPGLLENNTSLNKAQVGELDEQVNLYKKQQLQLDASIKEIAARTQLTEKDVLNYLWNHTHNFRFGPVSGQMGIPWSPTN